MRYIYYPFNLLPKSPNMFCSSEAAFIAYIECLDTQF